MKRTKEIAALMSKLEEFQVKVGELKENKQSTFDERSEKWQESEKGEQMQEEITALEELEQMLEEAYNKAADEVFQDE